MLPLFCYRYFWALLPPGPIAAEIGAIRDAGWLTGARVRNLHMTFLMLGDFETRPAPLIARWRDGATGIALPARRIVLDTLVGGRKTALLAPSEALRGLIALHDMFAAALACRGIVQAPGWRFNPHMTLRHGIGNQGEYWIDPVSWTARTLSLVESQVGIGRHEVLARQPLGAA